MRFNWKGLIGPIAVGITVGLFGWLGDLDGWWFVSACVLCALIGYLDEEPVLRK